MKDKAIAFFESVSEEELVAILKDLGLDLTAPEEEEKLPLSNLPEAYTVDHKTKIVSLPWTCALPNDTADLIKENGYTLQYSL